MEIRLSRVWSDGTMPCLNITSGHTQRVEQIEQSIGELPHLSLINNALHGVGIAPVIRAADQVAEAVVASFTRSSDSSSGGRAEA